MPSLSAAMAFSKSAIVCSNSFFLVVCLIELESAILPLVVVVLLLFLQGRNHIVNHLDDFVETDLLFQLFFLV